MGYSPNNSNFHRKEEGGKGMIFLRENKFYPRKPYTYSGIRWAEKVNSHRIRGERDIGFCKA